MVKNAAWRNYSKIEESFDAWTKWFDARNALGKSIGMGKALFNDQNGVYHLIDHNRVAIGLSQSHWVVIALAFFVIVIATRHLRLTLFAIFSVIAT